MKNKIFDVVMTATIRPQVVELTLKSFFKNFLYQFDNLRLIINIDPIGDLNYGVQDIIEICQKYFNNIVVNTPTEPSFPKAVQWCWSKVESEYFLHLEDDWLLKKHIDQKKIFNLFECEEIKSIRLYLSANKKLQYDKCYIYSNGFSLNPSVMRNSFIQSMLERFDIRQDPEKQFADLKSGEMYKFVVFGSLEDGYFTIDIGKKWRKFHNFLKPNITKSDKKTWSRSYSKFNLTSCLNYYFYMIYWRLLIL